MKQWHLDLALRNKWADKLLTMLAPSTGASRLTAIKQGEDKYETWRSGTTADKDPGQGGRQPVYRLSQFWRLNAGKTRRATRTWCSTPPPTQVVLHWVLGKALHTRPDTLVDGGVHSMANQGFHQTRPQPLIAPMLSLTVVEPAHSKEMDYLLPILDRTWCFWP